MPAHAIVSGPRRRRFSRTLAGARWAEYHALLGEALAQRYEVVTLSRFVAARPSSRRRVVLRHDVDQHPRSALRMAAIERELGVRSSWYFRWRTADDRVIRRLRADGFEVGFHYETLTRRLLALGRGGDAVDSGLVHSCRTELLGEIDRFCDRFGPITSICPHGDTRVPGVSNAVLTTDGLLDARPGLFDANEAMRGREIAAWVTDRSTPDGGWGGDANPSQLLATGASPMLLLVHPNNWAAGSALLIDRFVGAALPGSLPTAPIRTRRDTPA
jgi:hypothetical protein